MLPFKLIYHERYDLNLGAHVFPSQKFRLLAETLLADGTATRQDFLRPEPASDADILRVHTAELGEQTKNRHAHSQRRNEARSPVLGRIGRSLLAGRRRHHCGSPVGPA